MGNTCMTGVTLTILAPVAVGLQCYESKTSSYKYCRVRCCYSGGTVQCCTRYGRPIGNADDIVDYVVFGVVGLIVFVFIIICLVLKFGPKRKYCGVECWRVFQYCQRKDRHRRHVRNSNQASPVRGGLEPGTSGIHNNYVYSVTLNERSTSRDGRNATPNAALPPPAYEDIYCPTVPRVTGRRSASNKSCNPQSSGCLYNTRNMNYGWRTGLGMYPGCDHDVRFAYDTGSNPPINQPGQIINLQNQNDVDMSNNHNSIVDSPSVVSNNIRYKCPSSSSVETTV